MSIIQLGKELKYDLAGAKLALSKFTLFLIVKFK